MATGDAADLIDVMLIIPLISRYFTSKQRRIRLQNLSSSEGYRGEWQCFPSTTADRRPNHSHAQ